MILFQEVTEISASETRKNIDSSIGPPTTASEGGSLIVDDHHVAVDEVIGISGATENVDAALPVPLGSNRRSRFPADPVPVSHHSFRNIEVLCKEKNTTISDEQ